MEEMLTDITGEIRNSTAVATLLIRKSHLWFYTFKNKTQVILYKVQINCFQGRWPTVVCSCYCSWRFILRHLTKVTVQKQWKITFALTQQTCHHTYSDLISIVPIHIITNDSNTNFY